MEESWMNKLIELLNEYDDWMVSWYEEYFPTEWLFVTNAGQWFREEFILGKRYWFIQRLVENDKISHFEIDRKIINSWWMYHWKETTINMVWNNLDKVLIVLLSISENPISDLISYLK
jgi:hypothetical protein